MNPQGHFCRAAEILRCVPVGGGGGPRQIRPERVINQFFASLAQALETRRATGGPADGRRLTREQARHLDDNGDGLAAD